MPENYVNLYGNIQTNATPVSTMHQESDRVLKRKIRSQMQCCKFRETDRANVRVVYSTMVLIVADFLG
jgi:hypothetical protein